MKKIYGAGISMLALFVYGAAGAGRTVVLDEWVSQSSSYYNESAVTAEAVTIGNTFIPTWGNYWAGFAVSTMNDTTTIGYANQYSAAASNAVAYLIGYDDGFNPLPTISFDIPCLPRNCRINNTTWTAGAIRSGDGMARPFEKDDYYLLHITAYDLDGKPTGDIQHALADFRDGNSFIQTNWTTLDLRPLGPNVAEIVFEVETTDVGDWGPNTPTYFALADISYSYSDDTQTGCANVVPSASIVCWADAYSDYTTGNGVSDIYRNPENALGPAPGPVNESGNATTNVTTLGDGGSITLTFPFPIYDGPGADFAVFENAFESTFLEVAFVDVSSDGTHFVRFPSHCLAVDALDTYGEETPSETSAYGGLAGAAVQGYGTPFDLKVLAGANGLDINRITHIRIVDIIGDGGTVDTYGNPIYDPYPTYIEDFPINSSGFDLTGVGILNPRIDITLNTAAPLPVLSGYTTQLEYCNDLSIANWQSTNTPPMGTQSGYYRYLLKKH